MPITHTWRKIPLNCHRLNHYVVGKHHLLCIPKVPFLHAKLRVHERARSCIATPTHMSSGLHLTCKAWRAMSLPSPSRVTSHHLEEWHLSLSLSLMSRAIYLELKYLIFKTLAIVSQNTLSYILMSRVYMIFQMEVPSLASMPMNLKGITHVGFGRNCPLLHIWNNVSLRLTPKCFFL